MQPRLNLGREEHTVALGARDHGSQARLAEPLAVGGRGIQVIQAHVDRHFDGLCLPGTHLLGTESDRGYAELRAAQAPVLHPRLAIPPLRSLRSGGGSAGGQTRGRALQESTSFHDALQYSSEAGPAYTRMARLRISASRTSTPRPGASGTVTTLSFIARPSTNKLSRNLGPFSSGGSTRS